MRLLYCVPSTLFSHLAVRSHDAAPIDIKGKQVKIGGRTYKGKFTQSSVASFISGCEDDGKMKPVTEQPLVYPMGRKQDALDAISSEKDKAASTEIKGQ